MGAGAGSGVWSAGVEGDEVAVKVSGPLSQGAK